MEPTKSQRMLGPRLIIWELESFFSCLRIIAEYGGFGGCKRRDKRWSDKFELLHVHARILLDFFTTKVQDRNKSEKDDDVICHDFGYSTVDKEAINPGGKLRARCNKRLAHLSYRRFEDEFMPPADTQLLCEECQRFLWCPKVYDFVREAAAFEMDPNYKRRCEEGKERWDRLRNTVHLPSPGSKGSSGTAEG